MNENLILGIITGLCLGIPFGLLGAKAWIKELYKAKHLLEHEVAYLKNQLVRCNCNHTGNA